MINVGSKVFDKTQNEYGFVLKVFKNEKEFMKALYESILKKEENILYSLAKILIENHEQISSMPESFDFIPENSKSWFLIDSKSGESITTKDHLIEVK